MCWGKSSLWTAIKATPREKKKRPAGVTGIFTHTRYVACTYRRLGWPVKVFDEREAVCAGGVQALRGLRVKLLGGLHEGGDQS